MASRIQTPIPRAQAAFTHARDWLRANGTPARLSFFWLAIGVLLNLLVMPRWNVPLASWLYPIFFLRFARTQPVLRGFVLLALAGALVSAVGLRGVIPFPPAFYVLEILVSTTLLTLPYLLDRVLARRVGGLLGTLVFPLAMTTVWYVFSALNASSGTFGNPAYSQYGDLPLLQLLSITGLWGIDFLLFWLASIVNWAWERHFSWPQIRAGVALYGSLLAAVLLFGGARLAFFPAQAPTVRIAGVTATRALVAAFDHTLSQQTTMQAVMSGGSVADRQAIRQAATPIYADLLTRSQQEAQAGAKIIVWPEGAATVLREDEAALLARAGAVAHSTGSYLNLGLVVLLQQPVNGAYAQNESILVDPAGHVVWRYQKAHPVPGEPFSPGDGTVPTVQTPYGRLATVICFDADFPATLRQAGQARADVLLVPSNDWRDIDPFHTQMATYRAIENGTSLVRQTSHGLAVAVDPEGHVLGAADFYTTDPQVMVAAVPMRGVQTLYAAIGDLFAWLCLLGLLGLSALVIVHARRGNAAITPTSVSTKTTPPASS